MAMQLQLSWWIVVSAGSPILQYPARNEQLCQNMSIFRIPLISNSPNLYAANQKQVVTLQVRHAPIACHRIYFLYLLLQKLTSRKMGPQTLLLMLSELYRQPCYMNTYSPLGTVFYQQFEMNFCFSLQTKDQICARTIVTEKLENYFYFIDVPQQCYIKDKKGECKEERKGRKGRKVSF